MKKGFFYFLFMVFLFTAKITYAQIKTQTSKHKAPKIEKQNHCSKTEFSPVLVHHGSNPHYNSNLSNSSKSATNKGKSNFKSSKNVAMPSIIQGFEDQFDAYSIPNDDALAVANNGNLITMRNSIITFYNDSLQLQRTQGLHTFTASICDVDNKYDPRVVYDQQEDKFIVVMLSGFDHVSSKIIVCFSETNDPMGNWNFYSIPGNILNDSSWSDYPIVALNNNELFITVTNFADMSSFDTWDFYGCRVVQMNKFQGYQGQTEVDYAYHVVNPGYAVDYPSAIYYYNVAPVRWAKNLGGPNMYFVSTLDCNYKDEITDIYPPKDTVFLVEFTGSMDDEDFEIRSHYLQSSILYGLSFETPQPGNHALKTNYNTIKDAVMSDSVIHFVFNSIDYENNQAGFMHGKIRNFSDNPSLEMTMISSDTMGIAFPSIAHTGTSAGDESLMIGFNYTSPNSFPSNACMWYDNGSYSDILVLKQGIGWMNMTSAIAERWGDFTTMQLKYNEPHIVYFTGSFGRVGRTRTWVSKIFVPIHGLSTEKFDLPKNEIRVFPNPVQENVNLHFSIEKTQACTFELYDINGQLVAKLLNAKVKKGENQFVFDISHLSQGVYVLKIKGNLGFEKSEKVVKH